MTVALHHPDCPMTNSEHADRTVCTCDALAEKLGLAGPRDRREGGEEVLVAQCPKCGGWVEDLDGFGVLIHDECGYCSHPDAYGGRCKHCGETGPAPLPL